METKIITRGDVLAVYKTLSRLDKRNLIEKLGYSYSSNLTSYLRRSPHLPLTGREVDLIEVFFETRGGFKNQLQSIGLLSVEISGEGAILNKVKQVIKSVQGVSDIEELEAIKEALVIAGEITDAQIKLNKLQIDLHSLDTHR